MTNTHNHALETNEVGETSLTRERQIDKDVFDQHIIKNHYNQDTGDLPQFLGALSRVGELKGAKLETVMELKLDGTPVPGIDPEDAILAGIGSPFHENALPVETANYLMRKVNVLEVPERHSSQKDVSQKDKIRRIWTQQKATLEELSTIYNRAENDLKAKYDPKYGPEVRKGVTPSELQDAYSAELTELSTAATADMKVKLAEISQLLGGWSDELAFELY